MTVTSVTGTIGSAGKAEAATGRLADDFQTFLTLLVAQVQNQDPLAPMETTEFVSQLAQLTQVEQSVQVNSQMESLRQQLALNAALSETALIGRDVTVASDQIMLGDEGGRFGWRLEGEASAVQVRIRDASGMLVQVIDNVPKSGGMLHEWHWDGMTASSVRAENGSYRVEIAAFGPSDGLDEPSVIPATAYSSGAVSAIEYEGGKTLLQLADGRRVQSGDIVRAR